MTHSTHALATLDSLGVALDPTASVTAGLRRACDQLLALESATPTRTLDLLHTTAMAMHAFATAIGSCDQAGLTRLDLMPALAGVRALVAQAPFVHRLQAWPRGYAGDFETVEWLCDARNQAEVGTVPWAIDQCSLQSPLAQQHRNKVTVQARAILAAVIANPVARVASIGCGGCRDLSLIQEYVPPTHGRFVLVDADADALAFASERLNRLEDRCTFVQGRVPRVLPRLLQEGPFDLMVAGGLFDYLQDRWAISTLSASRELLAPGGRMFLSNIARGNPFRPWIENLADWWLIERDEADLRRLLAHAGFDPDKVKTSRDNTGLAIFAEAMA